MSEQEDQERYRYLQLKMKMSQGAASQLGAGNVSDGGNVLTRSLDAYNNTLMSKMNQLAPSNVGRVAGGASADAPGATSLLTGSIFGDPRMIMSGANDLKKNPSQIKNALLRAAQINAGGKLTDKEKIPSMIGEGVGTALEVAGTPNLSTSEVKASGPFSAGFKEPSTALPGAFDKAGEALGKAKSAAGAGIDSPEVDELMTRLEDPKEAKGLLTEARKYSSSGMKENISTVKLLAYKQVLGQAQSEGGSFADIYFNASKNISKKIAEVAPDLSSKLDSMRLQFLARGGKIKGFPWLTMAVNPKVGLLKYMGTPPVRNLAGAALGLTARSIPKMSPLLMKLLKKQNQE